MIQHGKQHGYMILSVLWRVKSLKAIYILTKKIILNKTKFYFEISFYVPYF